jgi:hypothetical protein
VRSQLGRETSQVIDGDPDPAHVSTSYVERRNLTVGMSMRRFTRLTNKKTWNHASVAIHIMHYNFAGIHKTLRITPAMALAFPITLGSFKKLPILPYGAERRDNRYVWGSRRKPIGDGFPKGFRVQHIGVVAAKELASFPPAGIAQRFRDSPFIAERLLSESYDKRYSPSTFIKKEDGDRFSVGWYSTKLGYECVREFSNLADAATDYLLFSLGKGRWAPA